jgi:hypothetical protein
MGLMQEARQAGMSPETAATNSGASAIARNVGKSQGEAANIREAITLATARATNVLEHPARKRQFQRRRDYPALHPAGTFAQRMRMPISGVWRVTE